MDNKREGKQLRQILNLRTEPSPSRHVDFRVREIFHKFHIMKHTVDAQNFYVDTAMPSSKLLETDDSLEA